MNTAEDIKRMLGELVDEAIRIGGAEGEKTLGTDAQLKEQVKRLTDDKRVLVQQLNALAAEIDRKDEMIEKQSRALAAYREPTPAACPFCGGRPDVVAINKEKWVVTCHSDICAVNPETDAFDTIEEAVSAWNHRAGDLTCDWR